MLEFDRGMPNNTDRFTILDVARQVSGQMVPVNSSFSFFCTTPIVEEDLKQYVHGAHCSAASELEPDPSAHRPAAGSAPEPGAAAARRWCPWIRPLPTRR